MQKFNTCPELEKPSRTIKFLQWYSKLLALQLLQIPLTYNIGIWGARTPGLVGRANHARGHVLETIVKHLLFSATILISAVLF
jgi:hypothetical protein